MLIQELANFLQKNPDDNIKVAIGAHPFSSHATSQMLLAFKQEKTKVSVTQLTENGNLYVCIINRKVLTQNVNGTTRKSCGASYEWQEVVFPATLDTKFVSKIAIFIKKMVKNSDLFCNKAMAISYKEAIAKLTQNK